MSNTYAVIRSSKTGLEAEESYVVVRDGISYLRILGGEPRWSVMTATASEDHGRIKVCSDQMRLVECALRLCAEYGEEPPKVGRDRMGREYVKIGTITRLPGESDEEFQHENDALFSRFFGIFDSYRSLQSRAANEMRELHASLAVDDSGGDVYLSDGMWLSSDGSLHDRGR